MPANANARPLAAILALTVAVAATVGCESAARTDFTGRVIADAPPRDTDTRDLDETLHILAAVGLVAGWVAAFASGCNCGNLNGIDLSRLSP